jgi:hypothetical protein
MSIQTWLTIGRDQELLESLVAEVEKNVEGRREAVEEEDDSEETKKFVNSTPLILNDALISH